MRPQLLIHAACVLTVNHDSLFDHVLEFWNQQTRLALQFPREFNRNLPQIWLLCALCYLEEKIRGNSQPACLRRIRSIQSSSLIGLEWQVRLLASHTVVFRGLVLRVPQKRLRGRPNSQHVLHTGGCLSDASVLMTWNKLSLVHWSLLYPRILQIFRDSMPVSYNSQIHWIDCTMLLFSSTF